jgi:hypothetical protein
MRFLATLMALVLSHMRGTWVHFSPKSLSVYVIQSSWEQQLAATTYATFVVDRATLDCLREDQETSEEPRNWQAPKVDFRLTRHPTKFGIQKTKKRKGGARRVPKTKLKSVSKIPEDPLDDLPM